MNRYLVDTCVVSELSRRKPNSTVLNWLSAHRQQDEFFISSVSLGELRQGIDELPDSDARKPVLTEWLEHRVLPAFSGHVLDYDTRIAFKWGDIKGETKRNGCSRPDLDTQIAATAVEHGLIVLTRNVGDMLYTGVQVCNPFVAEAS